MVIVRGPPRNKVWIVWRKPKISPSTWKLFCCVLPQQQNYSAVDSAVSFPNLSEISDFFLSRIGSFPLKMKTKYSTPNNKIILLLGEAGVEVSCGSRRPPPIQMPSIESTSTSMVCCWFCCVFSQPFRNQWFIFYPELVLFPLNENQRFQPQQQRHGNRNADISRKNAQILGKNNNLKYFIALSLPNKSNILWYSKKSSCGVHVVNQMLQASKSTVTRQKAF